MYDESKLEEILERMGLDPVDRGRYFYIKCPFHEDNHKSAQCFKDGWIRCHAGCEPKHINSIAGSEIVPYESVRSEGIQEERRDFTELWYSLDTLEESVKGVPASVLNRLGWRKFDGRPGMPDGVFIPYFNMDRSKVRFYQVRHSEGSDRRFSFAPGCRPITYGLECLQFMEKYLVFTEGSRDSAILRWAGVPAVALPSASSRVCLVRMAKWAHTNKLTLVCCGDRDEAGEKLISSIPGPYIDARTPIGKDVGDFYAEKGIEEVKKYYNKYRSSKSEF